MPKSTRSGAPVASKHPVITFYEAGVAAAHARRLAAILTSWADHLEKGAGGATWVEETTDVVYRMMAAAHGCDVETMARMDLVQLVEQHAQKVARGGGSVEDEVGPLLLRYRDIHPAFVVSIDKGALEHALRAWVADHKKWPPTLKLVASAGLGGPTDPSSLRRQWQDWKAKNKPPWG